MENTKKKQRGRGFNSLTADRMREIASLGGKAAHAGGKAHTWTPETARAAALKSNEVRKAKLLNKISEDNKQ